jgi:folylpolyglutamate synthase/dihydropteroate synthase
VERFGDRGKILVVGLSGPRTPPKVFAALGKIAKTIVVTGASFKGQDPDKVRDEIAPVVGDTPTLVVHEPRQALVIAKSMRQEQDVIILTGSTYMIEQALNPDPYLRFLNSSFGWRTVVDLEAHGTVDIKLPKPPPPLR